MEGTERKRCVDVALEGGAVLRVETVAEATFRIRLSPDGRFPEPPLVRYGIVRGEWPAMSYHTKDTDNEVIVGGSGATLCVRKADGRVTLKRPDGEILLQEGEAPASDAVRGFRAAFELREDERFYGLGDVSRERIEKRGLMANMWVKNVATYVPLPVLLSSGGWGLFVNTTWRHYVDVGHSDPGRLAFGGRRGNLDYYLFAGDDLPQLLDRYTDITGKPHLLPMWGYGLTFVCNQQASAREMLDDCLNFRREGMPCDLVGLEPGWMETNYDFSTDKKWHPDRFAYPTWGPIGPHTFLGAAERLGFKMSLWLCCDYDLSLEEERLAGAEPEQVEASEGIHPDDFEKDEHFGHGPVRMDKLTKPEEPWFEHLKFFVDQGVSAFKMDGANQVNEHPDRKWGNGMDDEEMHNLYPTLLNKQMSLGFKEHTGRRAMIYSSGGFTGIQQYAATWAGDTGGGPKPLVSILNHGLSGHSNASCDMEVFSAEGIHFGFFQPWSQVCSWAYWRHPWLLGDELKPVFKGYVKLRYRLLPYIYSSAHVAARTGLPMMRAMSLAFPDDAESDRLVQQYMFGDWFLTSAFIDTIHLPEGRWIDYWTGETHEGPKDLPARYPEDRGGPLFLKAGAIVPEWPEMEYVGQKAVHTVGLRIHPHGTSRFTMYEDDGVSYAYQEGRVASTEIVCKAGEEAIRITVGARQGEYDGMPEVRCFDLSVFVATAPVGVMVSGRELDGDATDEWRYDEESGCVRLQVQEDLERKAPVEVSIRLRN
jgi:alpha-glucosidase